MDFMETPCRLHEDSILHFLLVPNDLCRLHVYVESMKTPHGVQRDCLKYRGFHEDSMKHCFMDSTKTLRGLLVDSPWALRRLSVDSKGTASLTYLFIYLRNKKMHKARVEPGTFR